MAAEEQEAVGPPCSTERTGRVPSGPFPGAIYRVQLHAGFGFDEVASIADYLARLGVTLVFCSPYLRTAPGSSHGYDIVDHTRISEELGGEAGLARMCDALASFGMSHIMEMAPDRMATHGSNPFWWDVLEDGQASRYADFFDIDWDSPEENVRRRVLLSILSDHYGRELEKGDLALERTGGSIVVRYYETTLPLSPRSLDTLILRAADRCGSPDLDFIGTSLGRLPPSSATDRESVRMRHRHKEVIRSQLQRLLEADHVVAEALDACVAEVNDDPNALDELLDRQNYRLAYHRVGDEERDYRQFLGLPNIVAVRVEDPRVFDETHELVLRLAAENRVAGLAVHHPDGLRDPLEYLERVQASAPGKLLLTDQVVGPALPPDWPVAGTTGGDFSNVVNGLFVDPTGEAVLTDIYEQFTFGHRVTSVEVAVEARYAVLRQEVASEVTRLTGILAEVGQGHRRYRDFTRPELRRAVVEVAAAFGVPRTYVCAGAPPSAADLNAITTAIDTARTRRPDIDTDLLGFVGDILSQRISGSLEAEFLLQFQQLTPAVGNAAEAIVLARDGRLLSLNEAGADVDRFGTTVDEFHQHCVRLSEEWPATLLATSTPDSLRNTDLRARLNLISEVPRPWAQAVHRWAEMNMHHRHGDSFPDRNMEYHLYQILVGAHPMESERVVSYLQRTSQSARAHTSETSPNAEYDDALAHYAREVLGDRVFLADLDAFVAPLMAPGRHAALAQLLLQLTCPGIPNLYQGSELWHMSLSHPDNRRPVDYDARRDMLERVRGARSRAVVAWDDEGGPKIWLLQHALSVRRQRPAVFQPGGAYRPIYATGEKSSHVVSFSRGDDDVVIVVPRLTLRLGGDWADTVLDVPSGDWTDVLTGRPFGGGQMAVAELLYEAPVALLTRSA